MENNSDFIQILLEKIEKDDLPTNVFDVEGTDPLVLLGKMNEIIGQLSNFQSTVNSSNTTANDALSKAENAVDTSGQALSNANTALETANQAIGTSNTAIETANQSLESAQTAETNSNLANQNSNQAVTTANEAKSTAENALEQVTQGLGTKVYNNSGNLLSETTFVGDNGVNINMQEQNPNNFVISLEQTITNQIEQNKNNITQLNNDVSELNQTANTALTTANGAVSKNTEQDTSISALQTADGQNVKLTSDQTISGLKTFKSAIILETPTGTFLQKIGIDSVGRLFFDEIPYIVDQPIVSSGSNANGHWVRFANGTQICYNRVITPSTGANSITFALPFIETPSVCGTFEGGTSTQNYYSFIIKGSLSTTGFQIKGFKQEYCDYIAIGKWK